MTKFPDITKLPGAPPIDFPCLVLLHPLPRLRSTDADAALTAEQRMHALLTASEMTVGIDISAMTRGIGISAARQKKPRKPRRPTLASVAKQARTAGIDVARYEMKPDGTVAIITGKPEPAEPENPWLAKLRKKETKK